MLPIEAEWGYISIIVYSLSDLYVINSLLTVSVYTRPFTVVSNWYNPNNK